MAEKEVYTAEEAAEFLQIRSYNPRITVSRMAQKGRIRGRLLSHKLGYRFHKQALIDYLMVKGGK